MAKKIRIPIQWTITIRCCGYVRKLTKGQSWTCPHCQQTYRF